MSGCYLSDLPPDAVHFSLYPLLEVGSIRVRDVLHRGHTSSCICKVAANPDRQSSGTRVESIKTRCMAYSVPQSTEPRW